jgi:hypothetical protein
MLPIAVLPVASMLLRLGQPDLLNIPVLAAAGDAIFSNLGLVFAVGVALSTLQLVADGDPDEFQHLAADGFAYLQRRFDGVFVKPVNDRIDVGWVENLHGRIINPKTLFGSLWIWDLFEGDNDIHTSLLRAALSYGVA